MTKQNYKQSKTNDKFIGVFPFEFDDSKGQEKDIPEWIHIIPIGQWEHDLYGPIIINMSDIREFIQNFNAGVRKGVFVTAGHEGFVELPAVGWFTEVEERSNGLWGRVAWNKSGIKTLSEKEFKFFSPEMCRDYEDPETHQYYRNVLTGGALTKSPYFKELEAIVFSETKLKNLNKKEKMSKTLEEVLALDVTTLSDEDKAVIKENADKLTDEQKVTYKDIVEVPKTETEEEKKAREDKEAEDAKKAIEDENIAKGLNADGTAKEEPKPVEEPKEPINASEKGMVKISASELQILRDRADKGAEAFAKLEKAEIDSSVSKLVFSEENKAGKFLPKTKESVTKFMEGLNKEQRESFTKIISEIPNNGMFKEMGVGDDKTVTSVKGEIDVKVAEIMKDNKTSFSEALKRVFAENKDLEKRYNDELNG